MHYYGGLGAMFAVLTPRIRELLRMPEHGFNLSWYNSTILLTSLGYYLYPHGFTAIYVANDERALRRNVILMPLYHKADRVPVPRRLRGRDDRARQPKARRPISRAAAPREADVPAWFVGIVGGTGLLTALVPGSLIMLNASTTIARNIYREGFAPNATDREVTRRADRAADLHAGGRLLRAARRRARRSSSRSRSSRRACSRNSCRCSRRVS